MILLMCTKEVRMSFINSATGNAVDGDVDAVGLLICNGILNRKL